jgi:NAD+ kinase
MRGLGLEVRLDPDLAAAVRTRGVAEGDLGSADLIVAVGGDGTLLAATRAASRHETPVLGVHAGGPGSFGFLTVTNPDSARDAMTSVLAGDFRIERRMLVECEVHRAGEVAGRFIGVNDLVIRAQARMLQMRVTVGGTYIATYAADGIIVATPTGSTAYNLAAGGPLVHPLVETILLTPICPHTLNVRALLVEAHDEVAIHLESGDRDVLLLTVDGQISFPLLQGDLLRFRRAEEQARFVTFDGATFYERVQTRLRLGERFGS